MPREPLSLPALRRPGITLDEYPDDDLRGIGLVALSWSFLEGAVERIIWRLARLSDKHGQAITTHISLETRLDAACSLIGLEFPDSAQAELLTKLRKKIKERLAPERNEIVHSRLVFVKAPAESLRLTYRARGTLKRDVKLPDDCEAVAADILHVASLMREITADVIDLSTQKHGSPPP